MKLLFVVYTLTEFLSFCYIECKLFAYLYKDFFRQLKAFLPSFCHLCACEMSPGWGHLITWMDPSVGHLNGILARVGESFNNNFQKSQMPRGLPWWGGDVEASIWPIHNSAYLFGEEKDVQWSYSGSLPADVLWGSFVTHSMNAWQTNPKGRLQGG